MKKIIACLDTKDGRLVKGVQFEGLRDLGDPLDFAQRYNNSVDVLVLLDISATTEGRKTKLDLVERIAQVVDIPLIVGGGIQSVEDAERIMEKGAQGVSINSAAVRNPNLITALKNRFGKEAVTVAIDSKMKDGVPRVILDGGHVISEWTVSEWAREAENKGAGSVLLTSKDADGSRHGYDITLTRDIAAILNIPLIASGGAGCLEDVIEVFQKTDCQAALIASLFHDGDTTPEAVKEACLKAGVEVNYG